MCETKICQSCGMNLDTNEVKGTNKDGSKSDKYCVYCYKDGEFTKDITMDEMIEINLKYMAEWNKENGQNLTVEEGRKELKEFMPTLMRWKREK